MTDDRIRDGHFECDVGRWALNRALAQAVKERDEARAEVKRLRKERDEWRDEALAKVEPLRKERDEWASRWSDHMDALQEAIGRTKAGEDVVAAVKRLRWEHERGWQEVEKLAKGVELRVRERDEARAEVERLRKECNDARAALSSLSEAARRCVFEGLTEHFDPPCLIPSPGLLDALAQPAEAEPSSNGHRREAVSSSHVPARKALPEEVAAPSTPPRGEARPGERADSDAGSDARVERLKPRKGDDALRLWVEEFDGMVWAQGRSEGIYISTEQRALAELCRRALGGDA